MIPAKDPKHFDAFTRAVKLSQKLVRRLVPIIGETDAAAAAIVGGIDSLEDKLGTLQTVNYLRDLADRIEESEPRARLQ